MKLGKYGMMLKKYLEEFKPIKFSNLVIDGTIMDYLCEREQELKKYAFTLEEQLKKQYPAPKTNEFIIIAKYNNMIKSMVDEFVLQALHED